MIAMPVSKRSSPVISRYAFPPPNTLEIDLEDYYLIYQMFP